MNIALGWELLPWERELEPPFPEDPLPLDLRQGVCGRKLQSQPGQGQFRDSTCGYQIWPLGGTKASSAANATWLPKLSFHVLVFMQLLPWARS